MFKQWFQRARHFMETLPSVVPCEIDRGEIRPPTTRPRLSELTIDANCSIPAALVEFYCMAYSRFEWKYRLQLSDKPFGHYYINGGPSIIAPSDIAKFNYCKSWAHSMIDKDTAELWANCCVIWGKPFVAGGDGLIVLDLRDEVDDPPVVFTDQEIRHDQLLAGSFTEFLNQWENLCYIGPEFWLLEPFLDPTTGILDCSTENAVMLRDAIQI